MAARQDATLNAAIPAMRDYIVETWWATKMPAQASKGDDEVRQRATLGPTSNPAGWWGRAWTAVEKCRRGENTGDAWMARFEPYFRGLTRIPDRRPWCYAVDDVIESPPPKVEFERALTMWTEGQGRVEGVEARRAIEQAGMEAARTWLRSNGFTDDQILDTSATKAWDLEAEREGKRLYVEAKGSSSSWSEYFSVALTQNEVQHARENPDSCALVIAASCTLERDDLGCLRATPGEVMVLFPWRPQGDQLFPVAFKYRPGPASAIRRFEFLAE